MQGYDLLMLGVMVIAIFHGYSKGLAWQISSIASIVISYFVAYRFKDRVAEMIELSDPWRGLVAMMALFIGSSLVIWLIFQSIRGAIEKAKLNDFDKQLGAIFGGVKGAVWCTVVTIVALSFLGQATSQQIIDSRSGGYIARLLASSKRIIPPEIQQVIQPYIARAEGKLQVREEPVAEQPFGQQPFEQQQPFGQQPFEQQPFEQQPFEQQQPFGQQSPSTVDDYWNQATRARDALDSFSTSGEGRR